MRRKKKSENNGFNVWRSYSDMMAGVLLLFVLLMCVTLFQAQKSYNESIKERDDKIALQEEYTQQLLDVLAKYNIKVTFFVTNVNSGYQNMIAKEAAAGHTVAIHSASHNYQQIYSSVGAYFDDLNEMSDIIYSQTGSRPTLVRFPGGSSNSVSKKYCKGIMTELAKDVTDQGYKYYDWNVSSGDAGGTTSTSEVYQNVINGIQSHNVSVVLQHDIKSFSVDAVESIIQWGLANGYTFLPLTTSSPDVHHGINN